MIDPATIDPMLAGFLSGSLTEVEAIFESQLASDLSAVNGLCGHVEHYRGKMLRPTLVLLSGLIASGGNTDQVAREHLMLAATVEMIHMATLVHDDVLDDADVRRHGATVNRLWGNEAAVMLGDYLISNAFHLCSRIGRPELNLALGAVTNTLCAGELLQLHHRGDTGLSESVYYEIIRRKTSSLIAASCRLGGELAGAPAEVCEGLKTAGEELGLAFQIQDDLLDICGETAVVGKSVGRDLAKGKATLPIILHLARVPAVERATILRDMEDGDHRALTAGLESSGALRDARQIAETHVDRGIDAVRRLPAGAGRDLFVQLAEQLAKRRA